MGTHASCQESARRGIPILSARVVCASVIAKVPFFPGTNALVCKCEGRRRPRPQHDRALNRLSQSGCPPREVSAGPEPDNAPALRQATA